ncbi:hypothetical protein NP493_86g04012 [Ridgeia piscesae]|uniref:Uncharacterized protein n=1 Tax=Ridgeia piscesae TaxID=27915 RepID=A0AAD9UHW2_RIDPI|nr:hypothetical protein NP493_86g04012 [Ridgeia piscesae]
MSSALSGAAANIWEDFLKPVIPSIDERRATWLNRVIVIVLGLLSTGFAFIVDQFPGSIIQVTTQILGALSGPVFGMFMLGGLFRKTLAMGTMTGGLFGLVLTFFIGLGSLTVKGCHPTLPAISVAGCEPSVNSTTTPSHVVLSGVSNLFAISYIWYTPIGSGITIITGLVTSYVLRYVYPSDDVDVPDEYFIHLDKLFVFTYPEEDLVNKKGLSQSKADNVNMFMFAYTNDIYVFNKINNVTFI